VLPLFFGDVRRFPVSHPNPIPLAERHYAGRNKIPISTNNSREGAVILEVLRRGGSRGTLFENLLVAEKVRWQHEGRWPVPDRRRDDSL
jgi:hypothetical protein